MQVKYGPLIADARGSISGSTFTRSRAAGTIRAHIACTDPSTAAQNSNRARTALVFHCWSHVLTAAQRTAWNTLATATTLRNRLGETYTPTGQQLFFRSNSLALMCGLAITTTAPAEASVQFPVSDLYTFAPGPLLNLDVGTGGPTVAGYLLWWIHESHSHAVTHTPRTFRWFNYTSKPSGLTDTTLTFPVSKVCRPDTKYFVRLRWRNNTGAVSQPVLMNTTSAP